MSQFVNDTSPVQSPLSSSSSSSKLQKSTSTMTQSLLASSSASSSSSSSQPTINTTTNNINNNNNNNNNSDNNINTTRYNKDELVNDKNNITNNLHNATNENILKTEKNTKVKTNSREVLVTLLAGAAAGALAKTTIAPLDRTKINFQIRRDVPYSVRAALLFLRNTYQTEGLMALWRGNSATMARIIPYAAIQFTAHEQWRRVLKVDQDGSTSGRRFIAGSLAGITSQSLTYPLDLARARMAVTDRYSDYRTLRHVFVRIWIDEGPRTLLRGYWATIMGVIPYAGTSFFTYETLKRKYYSMPGEKKNVSLYMLVFGAIAGAIGQTSSYPLDIVRRRMQTTGLVVGTENQYKTILSSLKAIYRDEGIRGGFFKGLSMNWVKGPIAVGISFSTYDFIKSILHKNIIGS